MARSRSPMISFQLYCPQKILGWVCKIPLPAYREVLRFTQPLTQHWAQMMPSYNPGLPSISGFEQSSASPLTHGPAWSKIQPPPAPTGVPPPPSRVERQVPEGTDAQVQRPTDEASCSTTAADPPEVHCQCRGMPYTQSPAALKSWDYPLIM